MNLYDILGPVMVGPSSSHTAGAVRIGAMARRLLGEEPAKAIVGLHGSFGATGRGHGTDRAIVAGLLGMESDDERIPDSFACAGQAGLAFEIGHVTVRGAHPNTAVLELTGATGKTLKMQASSLGGGRILVNKIDDVEVNFTGEYHTMIIHHVDQPGVVSRVASCLAMESVNIAYMSLHRSKRGGASVMTVETDHPVPYDAVRWVQSIEGVLKVTYFEKEAQ